MSVRLVRSSTGEGSRQGGGEGGNELHKTRLTDRAPQIVMLNQPRSMCAERFRRLKTMLLHRESRGIRLIVVTSSTQGDGKSTVAVNLALAFADDTSERVLLVDADMRKPTVAGMLVPRPKLGLSDVLSGGAHLDAAVQRLENSPLEILAAGEPPPDPLSLLAAAPARALFAELRRAYGRVIVDTPPIVPFSDADALGALSDGILMVARAGSTSVSAYQRGVESVTSTKILGAVFNDVPKSFVDGGEEYGKYYDSYYGKREE